MSYILSTENTADFSKEMLAKYDIPICSLTFAIAGKEYTPEEAEKITLHEFYGRMRDGAATSTSMINHETAKAYLEKLLEKGQDILHISFASVLSGTCNSFMKVAEELNAVSKNKIYVVDSQAEAGGQGLLVMLVQQQREKGATIEEAYEFAKAHTQHCNHYFVVEDLAYLQRGGRLSKGAAFFGTLLNIKPVLYTDAQGRLIPIKKAIGRKKSIIALLDKMKEKYNKESDIVYISHGDCKEDAQFLADKVEAEFGIKPTLLDLDFVIGSHSGPGTVALFFTADDRSEPLDKNAE